MTRVLLVEDHALMLLNLKQILLDVPDFEVVGEATNGEAALQQMRRLIPGLVLMDLGLPVLNGIEVTRIIKHEFPQTRVLILTSHDEDESLFGALAAGADGYCLKGITQNPPSLLAALRAVRDGAAWLAPEVADRVLRDLNRVTTATGVVNPLSERELEVLKLVADGLSNQEIGQQLYIAAGTVRIHVSNILTKLGVNDRVQAAVKALRAGWLR